MAPLCIRSVVDYFTRSMSRASTTNCVNCPVLELLSLANQVAHASIRWFTHGRSGRFSWSVVGYSSIGTGIIS